MSNRVYTYSKITELKKAPYFAEIAAIPQITMSHEMYFAIKQSSELRVFRNNIRDFTFLTSLLFPGWNTSGQRFVFSTTLNQFFREKIGEAKTKAERDWLFGCKKNVYSAITNIIRLEEAGAHPEDFKETDKDILLFLQMWKHLENTNDSISNFRKRKIALKNPEIFDAEINKVFKFHGKKRIVLHGFQYFTPIQQFVYDCFVGSEYDIYALIQDEVKYPYANEIWNHLYNEKNGYPSKNNWIRQDDLKISNPLGDIFETGSTIASSNIRILSYANTVEFVEDISRIKEQGFYMYSADDRSANTMLKDYFPERYEVRNLLSYPIGQFVYTLHKMWDENLQSIILKPNGLRKCFASGWLSAHGKSSIQYTEDLEKLLPYFEGCYTLEEWNSRLQSFADAYYDAVLVFAQGNSSNATENRKLDVLGNPFKYFSEFAIEEKRIDDLIDIIKQLIEMAKRLFGSNEPVSIQKHMSLLDEMLYMNDGMPQELYLAEQEKIKQIFDALESDKIRDFLCYPGDVASALVAFMDGQLESEDEKTQGPRTLVFNLFQVESAPITAKGKVHICLSDISRLPGTVGTYSWPLDETVLLNICNTNKNTYLPNWIENTKINALTNRYYIYNALKNERVEISWIRQQGEKLYSPSPYITLIDKLSNTRVQKPNVRKLDLASVSSIATREPLEKNYDLQDNRNNHIYDNELEYALCPMRFVYSNVLGDYPSFQNTFQQNRAIVRLIQTIKSLLGNQYSIEVIAQEVFALFPYIRKAEKRQMIDDAIRWKMLENGDLFTTYGSKNYTDKRFNISFLDDQVYVNAKKMASMLMSQERRKGVFYERKGMEGSKNCEFCPHESYCMYSIFGIDYTGGEDD